MRVHRLELCAFGPFAGTEQVDFDELNAAGLFLLTGPTGAGKTSILDAICFGLYGSVPGDRNAARDLRSHHAAATVVPYVEVEVTLRDRRFRIRRSPAWSKPSRRAASGFADQHARATMSELVGGQWQALSSRLDEVGQLVTAVLGMNRDQFCQVVMLPQGKFQTFLQAGAKDRHDVLGALFATGRFVRIERWLSDHRRGCDRAYLEHEASIRQLLARIEEVYGDDGAEQGADWPDVVVRVERWHAETTTALVEERQLDIEARALAKEARHAFDEGRELSARHERIREARRILDELDATAGQVVARAEAVRRARAAVALRPLIELAAEAAEESDRAAALVEQRRSDLDRLAANDTHDVAPPVDTTVAALSTWVEERRVALAAVEALAPAEQRVLALGRDVRAQADALAAAEDEVANAEALAVELPSLIEAARDERDQAQAAAGAIAASRAAVEAAELVLDAARAVATLSTHAEVLDARSRELLGVALDAKHVWLSARERHLAAQAGLLAATLTDGAPCPVCGSDLHPHPAELTGNHASADEVARAEADLAAADDNWSGVRQEHAEAITALAAAAAVAGDRSVAQAESELRAAATLLDDHVGAAQLLDDLDGALTAANAQLVEVTATLQRARTSVVSLCTRLAERRAELAREREQLALLLGDAATVEQRAGQLRAVVESATALLAALQTADAAAGRCRQHRDRLADALAPTEFTDAAEASAAQLSATEIANAEALNKTAGDARAAATRVLAEPGLLEAATVSVPDLTALESEASRRADDAERTGQRVTATAERLERLGALSAQLTGLVDAIGPLAAQRELAAQLAAMVAGTSTDNASRTKLSHYVLSARLAQVVAAANVRLATVAGSRYQLSSSLDRGVGDARGGLGLRVLDAYTGASRDPATLSGGETFYVSLALALGLADLVRAEIGGADLSTLFVDEGFGTLDADTLDELMDELDTLRSGGRSVAIVSHLPELKQRIPTRLEVVTSATGSRIASG